ncbi:MAG: hypothetical protein JJU40_01065 [Rhodobacteraceae bacterium]|nr:hypothetical protein [Paracoccaceae bacterium]
MPYLSDLLLLAAALGAGLYCHLLARRLRRLSRLDAGLGAAVVALSAQVDAMTAALGQTREGAEGQARQLAEAGHRAEAAARRLELLIAALHDLPEGDARQAPPGDSGPGPSRPEPAPDTALRGLASDTALRADSPQSRHPGGAPGAALRGDSPSALPRGDPSSAPLRGDFSSAPLRGDGHNSLPPFLRRAPLAETAG